MKQDIHDAVRPAHGAGRWFPGEPSALRGMVDGFLSGADTRAVTGRVLAVLSPHAGEHSAENQIPFVQAVLPGARLVVGLIGDRDPRTIEETALALKALAQIRRIAVVGSTDLLHDPDYDRVARTDRGTLEKIVALDARGLEKSWDFSQQVCCGIAPVLTVMRYVREMGCDKGKLLSYRNSGDDDLASRGTWVVGYGAVAFAVPSAGR